MDDGARMKFQRVTLTITVLLLMWSGVGKTRADDALRKVLVLQAYHHGLEWSDAVTRGIHSAFDPFSRRIELYVDHLDALRYPGSAYLEQQKTLYGLKLEQQRFDVVIVADNEAYRFIRAIGRWPKPAPAVVFCGIGPFVPEMIPVDLPVTGVVEQLDHRATLEVMLQLHPNCRRVIALFDTQPSERDLRDQLEAAEVELQNRVRVEQWPDAELDELPVRLQSLGSDDLIYLLALNRDKRLSYLYSEEGVRLVARWSPVPIYSTLAVYLGKGIVGGKVTSGFDQGEQAGQMALRILSGEAVAAIPVMLQSPNQYTFDYHQLRRWKLKKANLPAGSLVVREPPPFWERHLRYVNLFAASMGLIALLLTFLLVRQFKKERSLVRLKSELDERMHEKIAQLQLVHQKLKKQSHSDDVTGIANRRYMVQRLVEETKKAQRYGMPLAIVMLDIDRFKQINDEFGYALGDKVLRDVGQSIKRTVRDIDIVGRFSAEVFLVILPNTDRLMGYNTAERIRSAVLALSWEQGQVRVAISGGLASIEDQPTGELAKVAKFQLARAKFDGGNRIAPTLEQITASLKPPIDPEKSTESDL